jgi:hypothetical protein
MSKVASLATHVYIGLMVTGTISGAATGSYVAANNQKQNNGAYDDTIFMTLGIVGGGVCGFTAGVIYPVSIPLIGYYVYRKNVRKNESSNK